MRTFDLYRQTDVSGVSGTGKVREGVVFWDGQTIYRWRTPHIASSTVIYNSYGDFLAVAVTAHPENWSRIVFSDGEVREYGNPHA